MWNDRNHQIYNSPMHSDDWFTKFNAHQSFPLYGIIDIVNYYTNRLDLFPIYYLQLKYIFHHSDILQYIIDPGSIITVL